MVIIQSVPRDWQSWQSWSWFKDGWDMDYCGEERLCVSTNRVRRVQRDPTFPLPNANLDSSPYPHYIKQNSMNWSIPNALTCALAFLIITLPSILAVPGGQAARLCDICCHDPPDEDICVRVRCECPPLESAGVELGTLSWATLATETATATTTTAAAMETIPGDICCQCCLDASIPECAHISCLWCPPECRPHKP
ncbi:uncharacterized protein EV422DRAFT_200783 [Fimicolochytrium jonesii]|uniref:uncharacterized protein n=1 Tax=Fimicolochytrium jonesii TaxID=1396493 RepID=UPI0022FDF088|nr:uncharacterized protein EV422DRAFT_200783 [Fimicolochytrium jonesii]KAI8817975.1 hypothetical protein EV422DRAFT_200783 [Fimicolochytrium jonesii]